jgi:hypothetical protein
MANPSNPILNQPINAILIADNTPTLSFTIPSDADNNNLVFMIELDTQNPINPLSTDYKKFESRLDNDSWQYWNGNNFATIPTGGINSSAYNQEGLFTVPASLRNAVWYWKISTSDKAGPAYFDQPYFEQAIFSANP